MEGVILELKSGVKYLRVLLDEKHNRVTKKGGGLNAFYTYRNSINKSRYRYHTL